jgi:hypothetical protein
LFRAAVVAIICIGMGAAKDKPTIQIRVVETQASTRQFAYDVPGTAAQSTTNCSGSATATGTGNTATAAGSSTCTSTATPATPPRSDTISIAQANVLAVMPDGKHITLWCQRGFRKCAELDAGTYTAEIDGDVVWLSVPSGLSGKITKIKYRYNGGW